MGDNEVEYNYGNEFNNNENYNLREREAEARSKIGSFLKRKGPLLQRRGAERRAANITRKQAQKKSGNVQLNAARAALEYNRRLGNIAVPPLFIANNEDPRVAQIMISSHQEEVERLKKRIKENYKKASLEDLRTDTNLSYKDFKRQIPTIPKASRPAYVLLAKMDDLYGKLHRNLSLAETEEERKRLAAKKYDVKKLQGLLHKLIKLQDVDPTFPMPPGLQRELNAVLVGEDVAAVLRDKDLEAALKKKNNMPGVEVSKILAHTLPAADRLLINIAKYEAAKEARYQTLRNQMNAMTNNSDKRDLVSKLGSIEDALEIVKAQITPALKEAQLARIQDEIAKMEELKGKVEKAMAEGTPLPLADKVKIYKIQVDYDIHKIQNGLYKRLERNRFEFNGRNALASEPHGPHGPGMVPFSNFAPPPPPPPPKPLTKEEQNERRRLAAEAAAKRLTKPAANKGGRRTVKRRRGTRKN